MPVFKFLWDFLKTERQGFEPWDQFPGQVISSHLQSATLPPLPNVLNLCYFESPNYNR